MAWTAAIVRDFPVAKMVEGGGRHAQQDKYIAACAVLIRAERGYEGGGQDEDLARGANV